MATDPVIKLDEFLDRFIDGYLLEDLRSMVEKIPVPHDRKYGAVGYPIVMTALAGVESLGTLTSTDKRYDPNDGAKYFALGWERWLYPGRTAPELVKAVRALVRNGIMHVFIAKAGVMVTREPSHVKHHLQFVEPGWFVLHADVLAADVRTACKRFRDAIAADPAFRGNVERRLGLLIDDGANAAKIHLEFFGPPNQSFQHRGVIIPPSGVAPSGTVPIQANSPSPSGWVFTTTSPTGPLTIIPNASADDEGDGT
jgi:hypothetical protein